MPDWFYRTVSRPILFRFPAETSRSFALGFMGRLARLPFGKHVIDFLGHMSPDPRLSVSVLGRVYPSAVGLGPYLDPKAISLPALARFGFGYLEIGPVTPSGSNQSHPVERRVTEESLLIDNTSSLSAAEALGKIREANQSRLPIVVRIRADETTTAHTLTSDCCKVVEQVAKEVAIISIATIRAAMDRKYSADQWSQHVRKIVDVAKGLNPDCAVAICIPADFDLENDRSWLESALASGALAVLIDGTVLSSEHNRLIVGKPAEALALRLISSLRKQCGNGFAIIASGGVHEPKAALAFRNAGADLVGVDTGLIYSGPGLPKRINDAFLYENVSRHGKAEVPIALRKGLGSGPF